MTAQKELATATQEYETLLGQLRQWQNELHDLDAQYQSSQRRYDLSLAEMEHRLKGMLKP